MQITHSPLLLLPSPARHFRMVNSHGRRWPAVYFEIRSVYLTKVSKFGGFVDSVQIWVPRYQQ